MKLLVVEDEERVASFLDKGPVCKVMTAEPYTSAKRVFSVVDNGSSHAGQDRSNISAPTLCLVVVLPCDVVASGTVNLAFAAAA